MEQFPKVSAQSSTASPEAFDTFTASDLDKLPAAIDSEAAERQLEEILTQRNFEFMSEAEQNELLRGLCEEFEVRWKLDSVANNKFRFLAEAVAKRRFETDQLAQFLAQNAVADTSTVRFH